MNDHFYNPRNAGAALWASSAEQAATMLNPDLSIAEIRNLPMMRGVYKQLRAITNGQLLPELKSDAGAVDRAAQISQELLCYGTGAISLVQIREIPYDAYIAFANAVNSTFSNPDFSTDDLAGFALCLLVWFGLSGAAMDESEVQAINFIVDQILAKITLSEGEKDKVKSAVQQMEQLDAAFAYRPLSYTDSYSSGAYGVLNWKMPHDAQVIMLGDWGTGMPDAKAFLKALWHQAYTTAPSRQIVFIHLGDIYYCGLPIECKRYFYDIFVEVSSELATEFQNAHYSTPFDPRPPIFTIPGNHEYYSNGIGYFTMLDDLFLDWNGGDQSKRQRCSFFCLRSSDNRWQFLGMDTGQDDHNALSDFLRSASEFIKLDTAVEWYEEITSDLPSWVQKWILGVPNQAIQLYHKIVGPFAPELYTNKNKTSDNEANWLKARISEFSGLNILCSHHQLFSQEAKIDYHAPEYLNRPLKKTFASSFPKVAAWYWGHEHTYAMYLDGTQGLNKGRLLGSSAYEATDDNDHNYDNNYPGIQFSSEMFKNSQLQVNTHTGLIAHAAAIFVFDSNSNHDVTVTYYQYPAWSQLSNDGPPPASQQTLTTITSEVISSNPNNIKSLSPTWMGNQQIKAGTVHSAHSPSVASMLESLFMVYQDHSNNLNWCTADLRHFNPDVSNSASQKLNWTLHNQIDFGSSGHHAYVTTSHSPASVFFNNIWHIFYVDNTSHIALLTCTVKDDGMHWSNVGQVLSGDSTLKTTSGFAVCMFKGKIYIYFLDDDQNSDGNYDIKCASYDPTAGGTSVTLVGRITASSGGSTYTAEQLAVAAYNSDKGGDDDFIMLVITEADGDLKYCMTSNPDTTASYGTLSKVNTYKDDGSIDDLKSSKGIGLVYVNQTFMMVRVDSNHYLKSQVYDLAASKWYGDLPVDIHANDTTKSAEVAQSGSYPSIAMARHGAFLLYRGDTTSDDIYWAYA